MAMSTFHKVTLVSCLFLSLSLLLPKILLSRGKRDLGQPEVGPGRLPPMMQRQNKAEGQAHLGPGQPYSKSHSPEAYVKVKTRPVGPGGGGKASLVGQIFPIYGFGILLYILYILFKITSKGKNTTALHRCPVVNSGNLGKNMSEYELGKLQEKLKETEEALEQIVSKTGRNSKRVRNIPLPQEERLLQQLKEVTRVMQESRLVGALSPEMEAEQTHYAEGWEGYPEETYPQYEEPWRSQRRGTIIMEEPGSWLPTAEEQAERMEVEEDEQEVEPMNRGEGVEDVQNRADSEGEQEEDLDGVDEGDEDEGLDGEDDEKEGGEDEDSDGVHQGEMVGREREEHSCLLAGARSPMREREVEEVPMSAAQGRKEGKQISFSDIKMVFCYSVESSDSNNNIQETKEDEEDEEEEDDDDDEEDEKDPIIMAENLRFNCESSNEVENEEDEQEFLHTTDSEAEGSASDTERAEALGFGTLRKRSRREPA
ncbi:protein RIC-3 isoform X2 [Brienomyrus brachyistius]|uniref:protein RIC-3 isoform X2 n=1 Tax=Brienomyrus brachyistius TaxID=42636 RepID=UPI0020B2D639|nr:protein RIC-3 isoform X2 [Brienomyrus brachyistius]